jgi:hypothetical protein
MPASSTVSPALVARCIVEKVRRALDRAVEHGELFHCDDRAESERIDAPGAERARRRPAGRRTITITLEPEPAPAP